MKKFSKFIPFIVIVLLSFWAIRPLLNSGFFPIHDDEQVGRLFELDQSLKAGQFPVRISQNLGFGYGYPLFNFYPPLVYYIAEIFVFLGFNYIVSVKLMIGLGFLLAAFFMYFFAKEYVGKIGAVVAAVAYTYAPYHALDVYVRGALPEFWSFVFLPAIFWSYKKLADLQENKYVIIAGFFLAGLVLTHNLVAMMSGIFIAIYLVFLYLSIKNKKRFVVHVVISGIIGLGLSASFWMPSFLERQYTMIDLLTKELADYKQHFVYLRQLWDWPWGYGGSLYGLLDGLSFEIGKAHIIGSVIAFFVGVNFLVKKLPKWKIIGLFSFLFILAAFMTTFYSERIWNSLAFFSYIQFPWRFLLFSAFFSSFLLGHVVGFTSFKKYQLVVAAVLIASTIFLYKDYFKPSKYYLSATDKDYTALSVIKWRTSIMAFEYVPKGVATKISSNNTTIIDIAKNEVADRSFKAVNKKMVVIEEVIKPQYKKYSVKGEGGVMRINTFSFPGWKIYIDKKEVSYSDNNKLKLIDVIIPNGKHVIEARFTNTVYRSVGNIISMASIVATLLYIIVLSINTRRVVLNEYPKKTKK